MSNPIPLSRLSDPGACLEALWGRIPRHIRITFCSAAVLGFLTHMYMFTNKFTNHDDLQDMFYAGYGTQSGRWLLPFALHLDGEFSAPWLTGVVSILFLAVAACLTVALLRIRRPLGCITAAAVLVAFPTVTATLSYMFTASAYFLALLLAVFGAYAAVRWGWRGSILGAAAITMSLGLYQSYLCSAVVLMVGAMLLETLDGTRTFRELMLKGLRLVGTLGAALAVYLLIVKLTTRDVGLVDYMGLQDMGKLDLKTLPAQLVKCYGKYFSFFILDDTRCHFGFLKYAFALTGLGTAGLGAAVLVRRRLGPARTVLALALAAGYPLAGNLIYIMAPDAGVHTLMIYGLCFALLLPICLAEYAGEIFQEGRGRLAHVLVSWVAILTVGLTAWSYMITDNNAYLKLDLSMRQCEMWSNRLLERIESCEGYEPGMNVLLLDSTRWDGYQAPAPQLDEVQLIGVLDMRGFRTSYSYTYFLRYFLGFTGPVYSHDDAFAAREEVQAMPCYPQEGSIRVIDGTVVVKLNP